MFPGGPKNIDFGTSCVRAGNVVIERRNCEESARKVVGKEDEIEDGKDSDARIQNDWVDLAASLQENRIA